MRALRRILSICSVVALLAASGNAVAQDFDPTPTPVVQEQAQVRFLLTNVHEVPSMQQLQDAARDPRPVLLKIARDKSAGFLRDRALMALGHFADGEVWALYASIVNATSARESTRHKVLLRSTEVFGDSALDLVVPFLSHGDLQYRLTAVAAIKLLDSDAAREAIEARIDGESSEIVRDAMEEALITVR